MRHIIIYLFICLALASQAQNVTVTKATSQSWSGGMAGHHGTNYYITLKSTDTAIRLDTAWIGGDFYPIYIDKDDTIARKIDRKHNTVTYTISECESYVDDYNDPNSLVKQAERKAAKNRPHREYNGAALITYWLKGKQYSVLVKSFSQLTPLCYP